MYVQSSYTFRKVGYSKNLLAKLETMYTSSDNEVTAILLRVQLAELADKAMPPLDILFGITVKHPDSPDAWYHLGMRCLEEDEIQQCINALFKAGKLAPYWYKVYLELGNYYVTHDLVKARCCYKKALYLNKRSSEVAMALSDIYRIQGETALNIELLTAVTKTTQSKWAWLQLSIQHFELQDVGAAVKSLLAAIRIDVEDSNCWEVLGDAYLARKAYTAAQKSYQKVVQLRPGSLYPQLQIARIKLITEEPEDVIPEFRKLSEEYPQDVPVLKGLAEACLQSAKIFHSKRLLGRTRDSLQEAVDAVTSALKEWSDVSCLWKLLGDIFTLAGNLPPTWAFLLIPCWFSPQQNQTGDRITIKSQFSCYKFASTCSYISSVVTYYNMLQWIHNIFLVFTQALKLLEKIGNCSLLWHDLAASYCLQSRVSLDSTDKKQLMQTAFLAAKKSISLEPKGWENWNLLGVIAKLNEINEKPLAQHCFIQSILNEEKNAVAWTNLGILYLYQSLTITDCRH
ncbi:superkiller complex protein 3-like isoform X1 [Lycorma delicatula]|uniref:superkiller complex protein 3-like isoform X1 n=1 Tax=Lycorma delicatula TaxID=130591 RepID=UPI003F5139E6